MPQEIRFATFNVCNLSQPGAKLYDNLEPLTAEQYEAKVNWTARQLDLLDADVIGLQEIFSLAALRDVLARSVKYRDAHCAGFDPDPAVTRLTPSVALVSRLPLAAPAVSYVAFAAGVTLPPGSRDAERFARPVLHATVLLPGAQALDVLVVHLKSRRPDYCSADCASDPHLHAMAELRSLIRRGTEAVALRVLLTDLGRSTGRPRMVLGDFNDVLDAVTTNIVLGASVVGEPGREWADRLFDSTQLQARQESPAGFTNLHEGQAKTIDHILVSEQFHRDAPNAIGEVLEVQYFNQHLLTALPHASDHGQVLARIALF